MAWLSSAGAAAGEAASGPPVAAAAELPPDRAHGSGGGQQSFRDLAESEAKRAGLSPEIADAVMAVESGYNPGAIGGAGEIGLMQILPSTARMLGFAGTDADLAVPEANIHYGVAYLAQAWRLAGGDLCTAVMKYRAGHGESRFHSSRQLLSGGAGKTNRPWLSRHRSRYPLPRSASAAVAAAAASASADRGSGASILLRSIPA